MILRGKLYLFIFDMLLKDVYLVKCLVLFPVLFYEIARCNALLNFQPIICRSTETKRFVRSSVRDLQERLY